MKLIWKLFWVFLSPSVIASPTHVDVKISLDVNGGRHINGGRKAVVRPKASSSTSSGLPQATLPYEIHQASPDDKPGQTFYAFKNIPYARQPTGDLRFKKAASNLDDYVDEPLLNDGSNTVVCPQEKPGWFPFAGEWSVQLYNVTAPLDPKFEKPITPDHYKPLKDVIATEHQNEECLVLDVFVPKRIYDNEDAEPKPVIVWFHGGGFVYGAKDAAGSPEGLLQAAGEKGADEDILVVTVNYRLGAFGWLGGNEFSNQGGFENAGLSDQKAALDWVRGLIHIFGGDPYAITVMGESAGASSILHHLTAYGISRRQPPSYPVFNKAILQSPAFFPETSQWGMNRTYRAFLKAANVETFEQLQKADTKVLIQANRETIYKSPWGTFTYGPVVQSSTDHETYVQAPPVLKMQVGAWFSQVQLMIANNRREGSIFTPPWLRTEEKLEEYITGLYPNMAAESLDEFKKLYQVPQKLRTERDKFLDGAAAFGDLGVDCNVWQLRSSAEKTSSYQYFYRLYPGFHGQDVGATFYPEAGKDLTNLNVKAQSERLQRWITCFAKGSSDPNCNRKTLDIEFDPIDNGNGKERAMWIGSGAVVVGNDQAHFMSDEQGGMPKDDICKFWNSAPYWEPDPESARLLQVQNNERFEL